MMTQNTPESKNDYNDNPYSGVLVQSPSEQKYSSDNSDSDDNGSTFSDASNLSLDLSEPSEVFHSDLHIIPLDISVDRDERKISANSGVSHLSLDLTETKEAFRSNSLTVSLDNFTDEDESKVSANINLTRLPDRTISHLNPRFLKKIPSDPGNPMYWLSHPIAVAPIPGAQERVPLAEKYFRYALKAIEEENYDFLTILLGPAIFKGNRAGKISLRDNHVSWLIKEREHDFLERTQKLLTDLARQYHEIQCHERILAAYESPIIISQREALLHDEEQKVRGIGEQRKTLENQRNLLQRDYFRHKEMTYLGKKTTEKRNFPKLIEKINLQREQLEKTVSMQLPEMKMVAKYEVELFDQVQRIHRDHCLGQIDPGANYSEKMSKEHIRDAGQAPRSVLSFLHEWNERLSPRSKKNAAPVKADSNLKLSSNQKNVVLARIRVQLFRELKKMKDYVMAEIKKDGEEIYRVREGLMTRPQSEQRFDLPKIKLAEDALQEIHDDMVNKVEVMLAKSDNFTKIIEDLRLPSRIQNLEKDCKENQGLQERVNGELENNPNACIRAYHEKATQIFSKNPQCIPADFIGNRRFRYALHEIVGLAGYCNISMFKDLEEENTLQHMLHQLYMRKLQHLNNRTPGLKEVRAAIRMVWERGGSPHERNGVGLSAYDIANTLPKPYQKLGSDEAARLEHLSLPDWPLLIDGFDTFDKLSNAAREVIALLKRYAVKTEEQLKSKYWRAFMNVFVKEITRAKSVFAILNTYNESVGELCDDLWITEVMSMVKEADPGLIFNRSSLFSELKELLERIEKNKLDVLPVKKTTLVEDKNQAARIAFQTERDKERERDREREREREKEREKEREREREREKEREKERERDREREKERNKEKKEQEEELSKIRADQAGMVAQMARLSAMLSKNGVPKENQVADQKTQSTPQVPVLPASSLPACCLPAIAVGFGEGNRSLSLPSSARTSLGNGSPLIFQRNTVPISRNTVPFALPPLKNLSGGNRNA